MAATEYDKLKLIDDEIRTLHEYCLEKNVTADVIEQSARCLLQQVERYNRKRFVSHCVKFIYA